jgi:hypothetical protein
MAHTAQSKVRLSVKVIIDESCLRILVRKHQMGLLDFRNDDQNAVSDMQKPQ